MDNQELNDLKLETNINLENFEIVKNPLNLKSFLPKEQFFLHSTYRF